MKKIPVFFAGLLSCNFLFSQNIFPATGKVGINTLSPAASLHVKGGARIGTLTNYLKVDSATGNLSFAGTAGYRVANNQFAFLAASAPMAGLFFDATNQEFEFRNTSGNAVFNIGANAAGNVGIGTATPSYRIDAAGDINQSAGSIFRVCGLPVLKFDTGNNNIWIGGGGPGNTTGLYNTANGYHALYSNKTGNNNTANGFAALLSNSIGFNNTANGFQVLSSNTSGYNNTANGFQALFFNKTGEDNTATGLATLYYNTSGYNNTANGFQALYSNTTGSFNTACGDGALFSNTTGSFNTVVGGSAAPEDGTINNYTGIGYNVGSSGSAGNMVEIGNSSVSVIRGQVNFSTYSDRRIKNTIKENVPGLAFINLLKPVTYHLDIHKENELLYAGKIINGKNAADMNFDGKYELEKQQMTGFIAQDVKAAAEKINYDFSGLVQPQNDKDLYGLRYSEFVVPLVKAVQELSASNELKDTKIEVLQQQFIDQQKQIDELKAMIIAGNASSLSTANSQLSPLTQNTPNPFSSSTVIKFNIPASATNAQILIIDNTGKTIKSIALSAKGNGQVTLAAGSLSAGSYFYTLLVDGKKLDTKQMKIVK